MIQCFCFVAGASLDEVALEAARRSLAFAMPHPGQWRWVESARLRGCWMETDAVSAWATAEDGSALFIRGPASESADVLLSRYRHGGLAAIEPVAPPGVILIDDPKRPGLLALRDTHGARGLLYARCAGNWLLASDERAFVALTHQPDPETLRALTAFRPTDARRTALEGVAELPPGCRLSLSEDATFERGPRHPWPDVDRHRSPEQQARLVEDALKSAIERMLDPDRPTAIAVSGGMDSPTVASLAAEIAHRPRPVLFSYRFPDHPSVDESAFVTDLASKLDLEVRWIDCDELGPFGRPDWTDDLNCGSPFVDAYRGPRRALNEAVRDAGCRVLLTGDFGDNLFLGAHYWLRDLLLTDCWAGLRHLRERLRSSRNWRTDPVLRRLLPLVGIRSGRPAPAPPWAADPLPTPLGEPWDLGMTRPQRDRLGGFFSVLTAQGARTGHEEAARFGLDMRFPLHDPEVLDAFATLPATALYDPSTGATKSILRWIGQERLPPSIVERPGKTTFQPLLEESLSHDRWEALLGNSEPWREWISEPWLKRATSGPGIDEKTLTVAWLAFGVTLWREALHERRSAALTPLHQDGLIGG